MIEAQLICSSPCEIPDLGLSLQRGEEVWVADQAAQHSADLRKEIGKGNVRMHRKTRKPGPSARHVPPFVALNRSPGPGSHPSMRGGVEAPPPVVSPSLDLEEVANRVRESLVEDVRATVSAELTRALSGLPQSPLDSQQLAAVFEGVLRRVMPTTSMPVGVPRGPTTSSTHAEPLFVPTNIVDKDVKGKVVLQSESSEETGDLDDAAAALREIKRRRGRTNGQENADD